MQAMIFAAGLGTRLRPLTEKIPKALVEVNGRPMLEWAARALRDAGVTRLVINTHYKSDQIEQFCFERLSGFDWYISNEPQILGTGGGLKQAARWLDEDFFLVNADILTDMDYRWFAGCHQDSGAEVTLAVNQAEADSRLLVDQHQRMVGLRRPNGDRVACLPQGSAGPRNFCGLHVISQKFVKRLGDSVEFSIIEEYMKHLESGLHIHCQDLPADQLWTDIGTHADLEKARNGPHPK